MHRCAACKLTLDAWSGHLPTCDTSRTFHRTSHPELLPFRVSLCKKKKVVKSKIGLEGISLKETIGAALGEGMTGELHSACSLQAEWTSCKHPPCVRHSVPFLHLWKLRCGTPWSTTRSRNITSQVLSMVAQEQPQMWRYTGVGRRGSGPAFATMGPYGQTGNRHHVT